MIFSGNAIKSCRGFDMIVRHDGVECPFRGFI